MVNQVKLSIDTESQENSESRLQDNCFPLSPSLKAKLCSTHQLKTVDIACHWLNF